jgi:hypothetical protein
MGRHSRRNQQLKQFNAAKSAAASHQTPKKDDEGTSSGHEILWTDEELDKHPEVTIKKLFHGAQNVVPSKRPFRYTGNSKRTQRRRKADTRQQAANNGRTMLDYLSTAQAQASTSGMHQNRLAVGKGEMKSSSLAVVEDENDSCSSEENTSESEDESIAESDTSSESGRLSNEDLIGNLERKLSGTSSSEQWRVTAVLQYVRLLKFEQSNVKASLCVARQLGRGVYLARRIRHWTCLLKKGQAIPTSMRGKHIKVQSLLDDEDVQQKILQYLRSEKFEFYLADFVRYVSNHVFPSLNISRATPIGYVIFCC